MFGGTKVMGELLGTNDNCSCIAKDQVRAQAACVGFILEDELPYCLFKSVKQEYVFTDRALIIYAGEAAVGKKRFVSRFDYTEHIISNVSFETAGMSATDLDCELKFDIGNKQVSIDVKKNEQDIAISYYRGILRVSQAMMQNRQKFRTALEMMGKSLTSGTPAGKDLEALIEQVYHRYNPISYSDAFQRAGF